MRPVSNENASANQIQKTNSISDQYRPVWLMLIIRDRIIAKYLHSMEIRSFISSYPPRSRHGLYSIPTAGNKLDKDTWRFLGCKSKTCWPPLSKLLKNITYDVYKKYTERVCMIWMHFGVYLGDVSIAYVYLQLNLRQKQQVIPR